MFLLFPLLSALPNIVYVAAAVLPASFLLHYVYKRDKIEKEPTGLLWSLIAMGCAAALCSGTLEALGGRLLGAFVSPASPLYTIALAFLVIAAVEEGTKFFFLKLRTWNHPAFNYRFDAVVYAAFVSLGFAALENVMYVVNYGLSVALPRALLAIPGHLSFSVFMGVYYGRARHLENCGQPDAARRSLRAGYVCAVFLHGFYDACAMSGSELSALLFVGFVIVTFLLAFLTLRRESRNDAPITPFDGPFSEF